MTKAENYAEALFLLSEEEGIGEEIYSELDILMRVLKENPSYTNLLDTPALPKEERIALADEAFGSFSEYVRNLIKMLTEQRCVGLLPKVIDAFADRYNDSRGILTAEVVTALALTDEQLRALTERLQKLTGKKILLSSKVDKNILGGAILRYGDTQLDGSVKTRLDKFREALTDIIV